MKKFLQLLFFISFIPYSHSQSTMKYYAKDNWVQDVQVIDDKVWIGNPTGLHILDLETGEGNLLQSVNSPLRGNFVREILPSEDYVWLALEEGGIARYDKNLGGQNLAWCTYYSPVQGPIDTLHNARNLMEDNNGNLWFDGGHDSRSSLYALKDEVLLDYTNFVSDQPYRMTSHGSRNIFFSDNLDNLFYFDVQTEITHNIDLPLITAEVSSFTAHNDELYVCFEEGEESFIYRFDGSWHFIGELNESINLGSSRIAKGTERMWYTNSSANVPNYISINNNELKYFNSMELVGNQTNPEDRFFILNEDKEGRIWFYKLGDFDGDSVLSVSSNELKYYDVHHSFYNYGSYFGRPNFDCDGNLLIAGLTQLQAFNPDTLILHEVLPNRETGDLEFTAKNSVNCKYYVAKDGRSNSSPSMLYEFENHELIDSIYIHDGSISSLHISSEGIIYVGLGTKGLGIYDESTDTWDIVLDPFLNPSFNWGNIIWSIRESESGILTFGTARSLVVYDGLTWTTYDQSNSPIGSSSVHEHLVDSKGDILVSYEGGIYIFDGIEWEYFAFYDPYKNYISSIQEASEGNYWLGTGRSGLLYWNRFDFQQIDIMNSALPSNRISAVLVHPITGNLWLVTNRGFIVFDQEAIEIKKGLFGKVFYDSDQDSIFDAGIDVGLRDMKVSMDNNTEAITDINGNYAFYPEDSGQYRINNAVDDKYIHTSESNIEIAFDDEDVLDLNFGLWKELEDLELNVDFSVSPFICSSEISTWITLDNPGFKTVDGQVLLELPEDINIVSTYPDAEVISNNEVRWDFTGLSFQEQRSLYAVLEAPPVEDILMQFDSISNAIIPIKASIEYENFLQEFRKEEQYLCSYDPNDKLSASTGEVRGNLSLIDDQLEYTIRFQNLGNFKAETVVLVDNLDIHLDSKTLSIVSSSHQVYTQINNSTELVFRFLDINLPPESENVAASQGFVKYRIKAKEGIPDYTTIYNSAQIYFDNNAPISTNITQNILVENFPISSTFEEGKGYDLFLVYPNPTNFQFLVNPKFDEKYNVEIRNPTGQIFMRQFDCTGVIEFSIEESGLYFIFLKQGNESMVQKIIIH